MAERLVLRPTVRTGRALRAALFVGGLNLVLSAAWIVWSSAIAARLAGSVEELERLERFKGLAFVATMSVVLGTVTWVLQRRVERKQAELDRQRAALVESEGRALAGLIASAVAHDMSNVLTIAIGQADALRDAGTRAEQLEPLDASLDRLTALARRLQTLGRSALPDGLESFDLARAVRETVALASGHAHVASRHVITDVPDALPFRGSESLVARIVTNLVLNAGEATRGGGRVLVRLRAAPDGAVLEVHDDGPGVPLERREAIFEPFVTGKARGSGLGLVSVRAAAHELGGRVEVADSKLGGACFRVSLRGAANSSS